MAVLVVACVAFCGCRGGSSTVKDEDWGFRTSEDGDYTHPGSSSGGSDYVMDESVNPPLVGYYQCLNDATYYTEKAEANYVACTDASNSEDEDAPLFFDFYYSKCLTCIEKVWECWDWVRGDRDSDRRMKSIGPDALTVEDAESCEFAVEETYRSGRWEHACEVAVAKAVEGITTREDCEETYDSTHPVWIDVKAAARAALAAASFERGDGDGDGDGDDAVGNEGDGDIGDGDGDGDIGDGDEGRS